MVLRILMLSTTVPRRSGDGDPSFILDSAASIARHAPVTLVAPRLSGAPERTRLEGVEIRRFAYFPARWERLAESAIIPQLEKHPTLWFQAIALTVAMAAASVREHRSVRPDVVHAQWIVPAGWVAFLLNRLFGTPYVLTARGADAYLAARGPVAWLNRRAVARASTFVAVSSDILGRFRHAAGRGHVQPSGVDAGLWQALVGERHPEPGRVLFVGRLAPKKGVSVLLDAVASVSEAHLVVVGDGPDRAELEARAQHEDLRGRVIFVGRSERSSVAEQFKRASIVAIPSVVTAGGDREGLPNVLAEAIATSTPVVTTPVGGIGDLLVRGRHALLCPPGDAAGLARCIREALMDPVASEERARRALDELLDRISRETATERYLDWYRDAVADA
jgi:colanic acid/amylovoran biosynthesis glycosyltransferase